MIAYVGEVMIHTYNWQEALLATAPDDDVYPYPRLDHGRVGPPAPHTYETVVLENEYTRLTLLPELGGRIYRWYDKPSSREMFYGNPVIKPTRWGARGWWLGMGGMEWAFPVEEHGLVEWRPWSYRIQRETGRASVVLTTTDERTGLVAEVAVSLEAGDSSIAIAPRISNPTGSEQRFQFWLNGMFALSPTNRPGADLRFVLPGSSVTVHSTGDRDVPGAGEERGWPVHGGRDMSRYGDWNGWLGVFAWNADYMGAYDPVSEMGVVRVCPAGTARGAKVFGPAGLSPDLWTDDGSGYVELWGGLTRTFSEYALVPAHGEIGWQERWYSTNGLGGVTCANGQAALHLSADADQVCVGAVTTMPRTGRLILGSGDLELAEWQVTTAPGSPFHAVHPAAISAVWRLSLLDGSNRSLLVCEGSSQ